MKGELFLFLKLLLVSVEVVRDFYSCLLQFDYSCCYLDFPFKSRMFNASKQTNISLWDGHAVIIFLRLPGLH